MNMTAKITGEFSQLATVETTEDDFYRGAFSVLQPAGCGHRSGSDALLIAAALPEGANGLVADLGAGAGVAGLAAIFANPGLKTVLVENNPVMADLARKGLRIRRNLRLAGRAQVLEADVTLTGARREAAGLREGMCDYVIMNPPYNHGDRRSSPDEMRCEAHVMGLFGLDAWMRTAVAILKPGGILTLIYRTEKIAEIIACAQGRFGGVTLVPVHARRDEPAGRLLARMTKGSRAPLAIMPGIVMHRADGTPTETATALINGEARVNFG